MQTVLKLFKLQIDNKYDIFKTNNLKKMILQIVKYLLIMFATTIIFGVVFFRIFLLGFKVNAELIGIVLLITQLISLFFAIGNVLTNLYLSKDNELLMVLPATPNQLFVSKILVIYFQELIVNSMIALPIFLALGVVGGLAGVFYLSLLIIMFIFPILPIAIASLVSIPVMAVIKYLKSHTTLSIITTLCLVAGAVSLYLMIIGNITSSFAIATKQIETVRNINATILEIGKNFILFYQLATAMFSFAKWYWIAIFVVICFLILLFALIIIKPFYFKTAMSNLENSIKPLVKEQSFKKRTSFHSLLVKEVLCVFRSPSAVFQYFLFTLLMPFIVFSYDKLMLSLAVSQAGEVMIAGSHVLVVAIFAMLSNIVSATAISREGGNFYISKIAPVNYYKNIIAKMVFNIIFTFSALLVTMFVSMFYLTSWQVILGTIAIMFASVGHIALSIDMDIKKPVLDWYSSEEMSKMGGTTAKSMIIGMIIAAVLGIVIIMMAFSKNVLLPWIIIILLSLVFCIHRVYILILRINMSYDKIEI